ncbi:methyltransferase LaeA [Xylariaceae sp. FL0594]|nr:methyltransferase LaeA [Xylariaceae sp. FL0594]
MAFNRSNASMYEGRPDDKPAEQQQTWHRWYTGKYGRYYGTWKPTRYLLPCDSQEDDRLDIMHRFFLEVRQRDTHLREGLYTYPLPEYPRVLDLGTGTGIWPIQLAERLGGLGDYHIEGWDLNMNQPEAIPKGVSFRRFDIEDQWVNTDWSSYDLIHLRSLNGSIEDYPRLYTQIYQHLKPGTGIMEQVEIDFRPRTDDGDPLWLRNSKLMEWSHTLHQAYSVAGKNLEMNPKTRDMLEAIGFVDVEHKQIRIPFNPWPAEESEKEIARWFNLGLTQGLDAISMCPMVEKMFIPEEAVGALLMDVRRDICKREMRTYCTLHTFVARRPPLVSRRA